jgi:hypothetical protein
MQYVPDGHAPSALGRRRAGGHSTCDLGGANHSCIVLDWLHKKASPTTVLGGPFKQD